MRRPAEQQGFSGPSKFGDLVILVFFGLQVLDGAFTYVGVQIFGRGIEANPILFWMMSHLGDAPALAAAKGVALGFGAFLHLVAVHRVVALLAGLYVVAAVGPWTHLLFSCL
jgi:hypothetical protein